MNLQDAIEIAVATRYLDDQSEPDNERYAFAYTIRIHNRGEVAARLLTRYWLIVDALGFPLEVRGFGVVGEQPMLKPGDTFEYTSGTVLHTDTGTMQGHYGMQGEDGAQFDVPIPQFTLSMTRTLH